MSFTNFPNWINTGGLIVDGLTIQPGWQVVTADAVFDGGTTDARGDFDGTGNPTTVFEVTGVVMVTAFALCTDDLVGSNATIRLGTADNNASLIASTTGTNIDDGDVWSGTTPGAGSSGLNDPSVVIDDIIETVGTANLTAGELTYYCIWWPLSEDGNVTAA
jgi:hypothetical protein